MPHILLLRPAAHRRFLPSFWVMVFMVIGLLQSGTALAQKSKQNLEKQKRENQRRIAEASRILKDVAEKKDATLGQLSAINQQISTRQALIATISGEVNLISRELNGNIEQTNILQLDLKKLKEEYGAMVYAASKGRARDELFYVFASEDFNQFFARLSYLRQYTKARQSQAKQIENLRGQLVRQQTDIRKKKQEKETLLASYTDEKAKLNQLQGQQTQLVRKLSAKEERLTTELRRRQEADQRLERLIADMVRREMRRAAEARRRTERATAARERREEGKPATTEDKQAEKEEMEAIPISAENTKLSNSFAENRGRLNWPVESGFISGRFGKQAHPVLKGVIVENLGINIQTPGAEKVKAVFGGEVGFVADIPGVDGKIVSIMHGNYFTVYSNLGTVNVKPGEKVKVQEAIGTVNKDRDGLSEVQFQIWHGNERLNPQSWLVGK